MEHVLPMEIIRTVSEYAATSDCAAGAKLCRVCRTVRLWLLPILYDRVILSSATDIQRFARAQMVYPEDNHLVEPAPASVVRKLWIGPAGTNKQNDLAYGSSSWPFTLIHQILGRCASLSALALVNLSQGDWFKLSCALPAGLQSLTLGPVHGRVDWRWLPCAASLREFVTMDTYMMDEEIQQIVRSPHIRRVRRHYTHGDRVSLAFDQLECVAKAPALVKLEIVCCAETEECAAEILEGMANEYKYDTTRVALIPRSHMRDSQYDPIALLFQDWLTLTM